ncbi:hypothetical protein [Porticoccus sp.]
MTTRISSAELIRRVELFVLILGMTIPLYLLSRGAKSAFVVNLRTGLMLEDVLLTAFSLMVMGAIVVSPFLLLALLGKKVAGTGPTNPYQKAGLVISLLIAALSVYLYMAARHTVPTDLSSTEGLVFISTPIYLCLIGSALYGLLNFLYSRQKVAAL